MNVNPDGTYELANLPAGEVLIRGMARFKTPDGTDNHFKEYKRALIEPGRETVVDFVFSEGTAAVEGRVTLDGETPAHGYARLCNQQDHWGERPVPISMKTAGTASKDCIRVTQCCTSMGKRRRAVPIPFGNGFGEGRRDNDARCRPHRNRIHQRYGLGCASGHAVVVCLLQGRHARRPCPEPVGHLRPEALVRGVGVKEDGTYAMSGVDAGDYTLCASSTIPSQL